MSSCNMESTARLYQSQWLSFCGWCRERGVAPVDATIPLIVDFLIHLRRDKGFSLLALKGYRVAISSVLSLIGLDLANSWELAMLFRSFLKACSPTDLHPPAWDVALVLQSLTGAPYKPLRDAEERFLAHKTLFLVALASAKRVGKLHALSYRVSHFVGWREVSLGFVPGFVAKTQDQSSLDPRFESFTVPALPKSRDSPQRETPMPGTSRQMLPCPYLPALASLGHSIEGSEVCLSGDRSSLSTWFGSHVKLLVPLLNNHWFHAT